MRPTVFPDFREMRGKRLLIALSGGADSVALTYMLSAARRREKLTLFAAHVDHGIRAESGEDADFCARLCERLDIPFFLKRVDIPSEASKTGEGLETCARRVRYAFLNAVREETASEYIVLAHHLDDQAETVLMHLFRGSGTNGMAGMRTLSGCLYRPLLGVKKNELKTYLIQSGLEWREDRTNALDDNPRNSLRLNLLPQIEALYPGASGAVARYASIAAEEDAYLSEETQKLLEERCRNYPFGIRVDLKTPWPDVLLARALKCLCPKETDYAQIRELIALTTRRRGVLQISENCIAEKCPDTIYLLNGKVPRFDPVPLVLNGETVIEGLGRVRAESAPPVPVRDKRFTQVLKADALEGCVLRTRREGDRIRPFGCGEKLLSDYLTDKGIDRPLRDIIPLVAKESQILWAAGLGISEEAAIHTPQDRAVRLILQPDYNYGGTHHEE